MSFYLKDPQSRVDYAIDWFPELNGRTIEASLWRVTPDEEGGIVADETSFAPAMAGARLGGGLSGHCYTVANQVTFSNGAVDVRSITVRVEAR